MEVIKVILLAIFATISNAKEAKYELVLSDENLFSACPDTPPGTLDVHGLFDLSEFKTTLQEDGMVLSGNLTFVWDIQPQDRVKMVIKLLYFDRGTWSPTFYTVTSDDFCKAMYESRKPWHTYWFGHIRNFGDVKDKCVKSGTKHTFEPYVMSPSLTTAKIREGLYKVQFTYQAFDANGIERPTRICYEIVGNVQQV